MKTRYVPICKGSNPPEGPDGIPSGPVWALWDQTGYRVWSLWSLTGLKPGSPGSGTGTFKRAVRALYIIYLRARA